jgi:hypothetical protein
VTFEEVADELYGLPADRFTEVRHRRAKELADAGHRDVAAAVKKLRKPSRSAWLANHLTRVHPEEMEEVLTLGREMRQAQEQGRGDELRRLGARRQGLVEKVLDLASKEAALTGGPFGSDAQRQLTGTVEAALASPTAAAALHAGRLTEALRHVGFGQEPASARQRSPRAGGGKGSSQAETQRRRRRKEWEEAKSAHTEAEAALAFANQELTAARRRRDDAKDRLETAARQLRKVERDPTWTS